MDRRWLNRQRFRIFIWFFKGCVVSVCLFSIFNWFYPYQNWGISVDKAISFNLIYKGSKLLIEEFPSSKDVIDTKKKLKKFKLDKLREECGIFGISNHSDALTLVALGLHALQHRGQEGCGIVSFDSKIIIKTGVSWRSFTESETLKRLQVNLL